MDQCDKLCSAGQALPLHLAIMHGENYDAGHYTQALVPKFFYTWHRPRHHWFMPFYTISRGWNQTLLTYSCPSLPVEHRPSTTPLHRTLFWAALVIPDQLVPCCFSSASVSRLQLLRGRPLFLFPCGFQVRAWRVVLDDGFLRVCSIQPHFLHNICLATGSCPAHSHRSSFWIFSCHWIL